MIAVEANGAVLEIVPNRPEKRNSLTPDMMVELGAAFDRLESESDLRVGILSGAGETFTSGLDLMQFAGSLSGQQDPAPIPVIDPMQLKARCTKPLICAVEGTAYTVASNSFSPATWPSPRSRRPFGRWKRRAASWCRAAARSAGCSSAAGATPCITCFARSPFGRRRP